jgi:cytochrome P450
MDNGQEVLRMAQIKRKYNLYGDEAKARAYETFAAMRRDDPVYQQPGIDGETMIWFLTRYEEIEAMLRDEKRFVRDPRNALPPEALYQESPLEGLLFNHMLNRDGVDHMRLRNLVGKAFTPRRVRELEPRVMAIARELIDAVEDKREMDLVADFAFHLPTIVILEMLGIPIEDRQKFRDWSQAFIAPVLDEEGTVEFARQMQEFTGYLGRLFEQRRRNPKDDLISALLQAEEAGDKLNEPELFSTVVLLIVAGHETTVNLISNAMVALWRNPEQLQRLKQDPSLMPAAVEEFLRYDGSVERSLNRWVAEDMEMNGQVLRRGDLVIAILGSAGRDPQVFERPEELDVGRMPNPHLGFGKGPHYCLGAPLARLETTIALTTLLERLPGIRPSVPLDGLAFRPNPMFRSFVSIPVTWGE